MKNTSKEISSIYSSTVACILRISACYSLTSELHSKLGETVGTPLYAGVGGFYMDLFQALTFDTTKNRYFL